MHGMIATAAAAAIGIEIATAAIVIGIATFGVTGRATRGATDDRAAITAVMPLRAALTARHPWIGRRVPIRCARTRPSAPIKVRGATSLRAATSLRVASRGPAKPLQAASVPAASAAAAAVGAEAAGGVRAGNPPPMAPASTRVRIRTAIRTGIRMRAPGQTLVRTLG